MKAMSSQDYFGNTMKNFWGQEVGRESGETQAAKAAAEMVQGWDEVGLGQEDALGGEEEGVKPKQYLEGRNNRSQFCLWTPSNNQVATF